MFVVNNSITELSHFFADSVKSDKKQIEQSTEGNFMNLVFYQRGTRATAVKTHPYTVTPLLPGSWHLRKKKKNCSNVLLLC